jgi:predicted RNase H-like nuclease (RuvC/YqgF family)
MAVANEQKDDELDACIETVQRLEEENEHLRRAAGAFGQLAERLNQTLREERRTGDDPRQTDRGPADRLPSS